MTYVMSDLHGCYDLFQKMLKTITFSQEDMLYIIGDVIDRGEEGIKILLEVMERPNIRLLMGNHEYLMAVLLSNIKVPIERSTVLDDGIQRGLQLWLDDGGRPTFLHFLELTPDVQRQVLRFLVKLPLYTEISNNGKDFVLVHSGLENFALSRKLESYTANELLFQRNNLGQVCFPDKTILVGHTPTFVFGKEQAGKILHWNQYINVDCGCVYPQSSRLGCLRLEDMMEFYV